MRLHFLRFGSFWGMVLGWLGFDMVFYGLVSWAPNYLATEKHLSLSAIGGATFITFTPLLGRSDAGSMFLGKL